MTVAVLIVNWNGGPLLGQCLESLERQRRKPDHIVVVDNASTDDSLAQAQRWLDAVELIRLTENVGFARANNIAASRARRFDTLALLNPDAVADPAWLESLLAAAERAPAVAAFASQMLLLSDARLLDGAGDSYHVSGRAWRNGHRTPAAEWRSDGEVFAPCAAAALYRREAFEEIGGFDERYFCYFEDVDLGFRLRLRGHACGYVPAAVVRHGSSAVTGYRGDFAVYHGERNLVWTFVKNMPSPLLWLYLPQHVLLNVAALVYYPLRQQGRVVFRAKLDALRGLGAVLAQRRAVQRTRTAGAWTLRRAMRRGVAAPYLARYSAEPRDAVPIESARIAKRMGNR
jgi:GT2 family glycosyltransferase